ncbi:DUF932 domain-containing protein [Flagellimonas sp.]|uniref:DUF932 domain-containing protein n=1 Tax=Flagellimonas sp. TaxID=2058762 RepID=UPI003AB1AF8F
MHDINFNNSTGKYSFFSVKQTAWHGLGKVVTDHPTSAEAIRHAGLDYQVEKVPMFTHWYGQDETEAGGLPVKTEMPVPDNFATRRADTGQILGVVGNAYHIVQNTDAFSFFDGIVGGGDGVLYETAGALGKGERIFITAKLPGYIRVGNGEDITDKYIFLTNTHDGKGSITVAFTPIRVVCRNTLNAALRNMTQVVRIRHTANAGQRLQDARKVMGLADTFFGQLDDIFNHWAKTPITDKHVRKLIEMALCPNKQTWEALKNEDRDSLSANFKNTCNDAFAYAMACDTQQMETTKGTVFGAYNAITGYYQNVRSYTSENDKIKSTLLGGTAQLRANRSFELCNGYARFGADALSMN